MGPESEPDPESRQLSHQEQIDFLRLIHDGLGRLMACSQLKLSERVVARTIAQSAAFRRALAQVEKLRAENLYSILYAAALRGNTRAARFLLARYDREQRVRG
jgi:hypothetical protein